MTYPANQMDSIFKKMEKLDLHLYNGNITYVYRMGNRHSTVDLLHGQPFRYSWSIAWATVEITPLGPWRLLKGKSAKTFACERSEMFGGYEELLCKLACRSSN